MGNIFDNNSSNNSKSTLDEYITLLLTQGMQQGYVDDVLRIDSKQIDDGMMNELCVYIVNLGNKVKVLSLNRNYLTTNGAIILFNALRSSNSNIRSIYLGGNNGITSDCITSLGGFIKNSKTIEHIDLSSTLISNSGVQELASYLDGNVTLKSLVFALCSDISDESTPSLIKMIKTSHLVHLDINRTSITKFKDFSLPLSYNVLKYGSAKLDFTYDCVDDDDIIKVCEYMKEFGIKDLKELIIGKNKITPKGGSKLLDTLRECNSTIKFLCLPSNLLDEEVVKQLGEFIQSDDHVEKLYFLGNGLTNNDLGILSQHMMGNAALKELWLNNNRRITDESTPYLIEIANKSYLTTINLWNTSISNVDQKAIREALKIPIDQRALPIQSNSKSAAKAYT